MENHSNRPEVVQAEKSGVGSASRRSPTEQRPMLYVARRLSDGSVLRLAVSAARLRQVELGYLLTMRLRSRRRACSFCSAASRRRQPIAD
jgi:hypothetical protein